MGNRDLIARARDNWVDRGWEASADGMAFVTSVMRVQQVLLGRIESMLRPHGLSFARFEVLRLLAFARRGEMPIGKVGERLQVHPASVTSAVHRLVDDGHATRRPNPDDGRSVIIGISAAGRELVERCTEELNAEVFEIVPISKAAQRDAFDLLREVRAGFGDFDGGGGSVRPG